MKSNNFSITGFCFAYRVVSFALFSLFLFSAVLIFLSNASSSNSIVIVSSSNIICSSSSSSSSSSRSSSRISSSSSISSSGSSSNRCRSIRSSSRNPRQFTLLFTYYLFFQV